MNILAGQGFTLEHFSFSGIDTKELTVLLSGQLFIFDGVVKTSF